MGAPESLKESLIQKDLFPQDCIPLYGEFIDKGKEQGWTERDFEFVRLAVRVMLVSIRGKIAQEGPYRKDGASSWASHCFEVAVRSLRDKAPARVVAMGLCHDTIEDTADYPDGPQITQQDLSEIFSPFDAKFAHSIALMTKKKMEENHLPMKERRNNPIETHRRLYELIEFDPEAILVKIHDRGHYLDTSLVIPRQKRREKARETLDVYVPLMVGLGLHEQARELASKAVLVFMDKDAHVLDELPVTHEAYEKTIEIIINRIKQVSQKISGIIETTSRLPDPSDIYHITTGRLADISRARIPSFITVVMKDHDGFRQGATDLSFYDVARPIMLELLDAGIITDEEYQEFANLLKSGIQRTTHIDVVVHDVPMRLRFATERDEREWQASILNSDGAREKIERLKAIYRFYLQAGVKTTNLLRNIRECLLRGTTDVVIQTEHGLRHMVLPADATALDLAFAYLPNAFHRHIERIEIQTGSDKWDIVKPQAEVQSGAIYKITTMKEDTVSSDMLDSVQTAYGVGRVQELLYEQVRRGNETVSEALIQRGRRIIERLFTLYAQEQGADDSTLRTDIAYANGLLTELQKEGTYSPRIDFLLRVGFGTLVIDSGRTSLVWQVVRMLYERQSGRRHVFIVLNDETGALNKVTEQFMRNGINIADIYSRPYYSIRDRRDTRMALITITLDAQEYEKFERGRSRLPFHVL